MTSVITSVGLGRNYVVGSETVRALRDVDLTIERNEYVAERAERKIVLRDGVVSSDAPTRREVAV